MHATAQLENFYYYMQGLIQKLRAAFGIGQKGHIFLKKGPKKSTTTYTIPFLSVLFQNKVLNNFAKGEAFDNRTPKKV